MSSLVFNKQRRPSTLGLNLIINRNSVGKFKSKSAGRIPQHPSSNKNFNKVSLTLSDLKKETKSHTPLNSKIELNPAKLSVSKLITTAKHSQKSEPGAVRPKVTSAAPVTTQIRKEQLQLYFRLQRYRKLGMDVNDTLSKHSSLADLKEEMERCKDNRRLENSIKFQKKMVMAFVTALEFLNTRFGPEDIQLDGFAESMHESCDLEFEEVFTELFYKYRERAKIMPEVRLLMMIGGSAFIFHLTKSITRNMMKTGVPMLDTLVKNNPQILQSVVKNMTSKMCKKSQTPPETPDPSPRKMKSPKIKLFG